MVVLSSITPPPRHGGVLLGGRPCPIAILALGVRPSPSDAIVLMKVRGNHFLFQHYKSLDCGFERSN